jgi:ABC-type uncharacterized transport system YnjBCD permease subunit
MNTVKKGGDMQQKMKAAMCAVVLCLVGGVQAAETVKQTMVGCTTMPVLREAIRYAVEGDVASIKPLLRRGLCVILKEGEAVSVIESNESYATLRYQGFKLYAQADILRAED